MNYRNAKLRESAKYVCCVSCGHPDAMWAHSNYLAHGKGRGIKSHDIFGAYLCLNCHDWFDGRSNIAPPTANENKKLWFMAMWEESIRIACDEGYL